MVIVTGLFIVVEKSVSRFRSGFLINVELGIVSLELVV